MMGTGLRPAARELGISHVSLLEAAKDGRAPRLADGSFDLDAVRASEWWQGRGEGRQAHRSTAVPAPARVIYPPPPEQQPDPPLDPGEEEEGDEDEPEPEPSKAKLSGVKKIELEKLVLSRRAKKLQIDNDRERKILINAAEVEANWTDIGAQIQRAVMGFKASLVNRLPVEWRHEVSLAADDEARKLLNSLADEIERDTEAA